MHGTCLGGTYRAGAVGLGASFLTMGSRLAASKGFFELITNDVVPINIINSRWSLIETTC